MHNIKLLLQIMFVCGLMLMTACSQEDSASVREKNRLEYEQRSEAEAKAVGDAYRKALNNEKDGFLDLYSIGCNKDDKYAVEYQESANDSLTELLYTKTDLWIAIFSKVKGFKFYLGVFPESISEEKYIELVVKNLDQKHWNKDEARLANEIKRELLRK